MKILQVLQFFSPVHGGSAESPYRLSKELAKRGHDVTIYASDYKSSQEYINSIPEVKVYLFRSWLNYAKFHVTPSIIKRAKKEIKHFDIIHMHNYRTFQNIVVYYYAKKYEVPYILQPRGSIPRFARKKNLKKLFDILFGHAIIRGANKIIASSKIESEQYRDVFSKLKDEKIVHMPNGIDLETYCNLPQKGEFKKKYSINNNEKIILFLSRIHERKGADTLIEAFSILKREFDGVKLVIAGPDDGYLNNVKSIARELCKEGEVTFIGPLYEEDKLEAYVDADIFVLPSKSKEESFGNVVLESLACGTPVIITDNCGVSEWITDDVGYVVEYDKDQLRDAIFKILSDERLRRRFGEEGRNLVMNEFGWDSIIKKVEDVYENCVE